MSPAQARARKAIRVVGEQAGGPAAMSALNSLIAGYHFVKPPGGGGRICVVRFKSGHVLTGFGADRRSAAGAALDPVWPLDPHVLAELLDQAPFDEPA